MLLSWHLFLQLLLGYGLLVQALPEHCLNLINGRNDYPNIKEEGTNDNGFVLDIRRLRDNAMVDGWFEPGKDYIVKLTNRRPFVTFNDFLLWLVPSNTKQATLIQHEEQQEYQKDEDCTLSLSPKCVGNWVHRGSQGSRNLRFGRVSTRNRINCQNTVVERHPDQYPSLHRNIQAVTIGWRAPSGPSADCITIHGMVRTFSTVWKEVGGLMKTLCPSKMRPMQPVLPSTIAENRTTSSDLNYPGDMRSRDTMQASDCCACGTATYRITFQGLWNRTTHPKDWPVKNPSLLHWTNLIGASHSPSYAIYSIGQPASAGVQSICAYGDTTIMRQSLSLTASKSEGYAHVPTGSASTSRDVSPLHSLISTPGMWGEEVLMEPRTTLFSVNRTHPLVSMLTMLGPSPDWCTGFSGESLCQADCTWIDNKTLHLYPWDAGIRNGNTYMPKDADRKEIPDPIRYIDEKWMPNNPFYEHKPIARVEIVRVLPQKQWQCTKHIPDGVQLFELGGGVHVTGEAAKSKEQTSGQSARQVGGKKRGSGKEVGFGGAGGSGTIGTNDPLSDPSLAQMATFLCITGDWSAWSACSVTCGVGHRTRHRSMISNKKPELCQHVPLSMQESCEGRKRTCDFSAPCSFLPWTSWTPCNATCENPKGLQSRKQALARSDDKGCEDLFETDAERSMKTRVETKVCEIPSEACDPVTICGEGPKEGYQCGKPRQRYYYNAIEHECMPFNYLGCKGGRNMFKSKQECRDFCIKAVESIPAWRRERMGLLMFKTSQISSLNDNSRSTVNTKQDQACHYEVNVGEECGNGTEWTNHWYYCSRTSRCRDFVYLGCKGTPNRFANHTACMQACMPEEYFKVQQLAKIRETTMKLSSPAPAVDVDDSDDSAVPPELDGVGVNPKQDCRVTQWGAWGPCSVPCSSQVGYQLRLRAIKRPSRFGGIACGPLFEKRECKGSQTSC